MAIKIDILSNTRDAVRGVEDYGAALDEVGGSLDDVARDAQRAGDKTADAFDDTSRGAERNAEKIGDSYKEAGRDGERSAERLERAFKDASDATAKAAHEGGDKLGQSTRRGVDDAKEGLGEFRDEANSTAKESAASFDGSAESIGDAFQEVAANAFAGFGPAGAIAGLAAAAGIGVVFSKMEQGKEQTEAFKEGVAELAQELIDTGGIGETSIGYIVDRLNELATTTEEGVTTLGDLQDAARTAGGDVESISQAYAGNTDELDKLVKKQEDYLDTLGSELDQIDLNKEGAYRAAFDKVEAQQLVVDKLHEVKESTDEAAAQEQAYLDSGAAGMQAKAELIGNINDAYDDAAGGAEDFLDKESGIFDVQGFIDSMKQRELALAEYQETLATSALTPEAKEFISSQGVDSAATFMAGYKTATPAQQAELNRIWSEAGTTSSGAFSGSTKAELRQAGYEAQVKLNPDASAIRAYLSQVKTQDILLRVQNRIDLPARQGMGVP